jgi:transcriptional regulator with XRE-family HTH domain
MGFGEWIKAARLKKGLTIKQLCALINCDFFIYSDIENGKHLLLDSGYTVHEQMMLSKLTRVLEIDERQMVYEIRKDLYKDTMGNLITGFYQAKELIELDGRLLHETANKKIKQLLDDTQFRYFLNSEIKRLYPQRGDA